MKRRRTGLGILGLVLALVAGGYFLFAFKERVYTGNTFVTEASLDKALMKKPYNQNTLLFLLDLKWHPHPLPEGVKEISAELTKPWAVTIHVTEERPLAQIRDVDGKYAVFGEKGHILYMARSEEKNLFTLQGLSVTERPRRGKKVVPKDDRFFEKIRHLVRGLESSRLEPESVQIKKDGCELKFQQITVKMGKSFYAEKIEMLPGILEKLKGRSGVLDLSEQSPRPKYVSFRPDTEEEAEKEKETEEEEGKDIVSSQ